MREPPPVRRSTLLLLLLLLLPLAGCIEDRLLVQLHTQVFADGSCTRRIEYVLERVDTDRGDRRVDIPPDGDPLRQKHRFPSGEAWRIEEETSQGLHRIVVEATLPSPNDFDGDFFRAHSPQSPPARNFISAYTSPDDGVFEYNEVLRDPVSPLAGARALARQLSRRDEDFARHVLDALGDAPGGPHRAGLSRAFRELLADPFAEDVATLTSRPLYGPRERRALDEVIESLEVRQQDLDAAVQALAPTLPVDELDEAVESSLDAVGEEVLAQSEAALQALGLEGRTSPIHFRATLVMPFPVRRANACATGDTVVWEFEGQELYGRGFEMMALASAP
jgi:hypothetical protein